METKSSLECVFDSLRELARRIDEESPPKFEVIFSVGVIAGSVGRAIVDESTAAIVADAPGSRARLDAMTRGRWPSIVQVIGEYLPIEERGGDVWRARCPFGRHARLLDFFPLANLWRCDACNLGGDAADFVARYDLISRDEAIDVLRRWHDADVVAAADDADDEDDGDSDDDDDDDVDDDDDDEEEAPAPAESTAPAPAAPAAPERARTTREILATVDRVGPPQLDPAGDPAATFVERLDAHVNQLARILADWQATRPGQPLDGMQSGMDCAIDGLRKLYRVADRCWRELRDIKAFGEPGRGDGAEDGPLGTAGAGRRDRRRDVRLIADRLDALAVGVCHEGDARTLAASAAELRTAVDASDRPWEPIAFRLAGRLHGVLLHWHVGGDAHATLSGLVGWLESLANAPVPDDRRKDET